VGVDEIRLEADVEEDNALEEEEVESVLEVDDEESEEVWLAVVDTPSVGVVIGIAGVEGETWAGVGAVVPVALGPRNDST